MSSICKWLISTFCGNCSVRCLHWVRWGPRILALSSAWEGQNSIRGDFLKNMTSEQNCKEWAELSWVKKEMTRWKLGKNKTDSLSGCNKIFIITVVKLLGNEWQRMRSSGSRWEWALSNHRRKSPNKNFLDVYSVNIYRVNSMYRAHCLSPWLGHKKDD